MPSLRPKEQPLTLAAFSTSGEMIAHLPIPGGHISLAQRFVNPGFSVTMGWNYCEYSLDSAGLSIGD